MTTHAPDGISVTVVATPWEIEAAKTLILEYGDSLGIELCFQNFDEEMAQFPAAYSHPDGLALLATNGGEPAGCVCVRKLDESTCEMKRLYVRPELRGRKIGRLLATAAINAAQGIGYRTMRLDTLATMAEAIALYRSLGFRPITAYYESPIADAIYLERLLSDEQPGQTPA